MAAVRRGQRTPLDEDAIVEIIDSYDRGVPLARICREFHIGRARCGRLIADNAMRVVGTAYAAEGEVEGGGASAMRLTPNFMAEEPPAPEIAEVSCPVLPVDGNAAEVRRKKKKKRAAAEKAAAKREMSAGRGAASADGHEKKPHKKRDDPDTSIRKVNRAMAAIEVGSDDRNIVEEGKDAVDNVRRAGLVAPAEARRLKREITEAAAERFEAELPENRRAAALGAGSMAEYVRVLKMGRQ